MYIFISIKMFDDLTRVYIDARKFNVVFISLYLCIRVERNVRIFHANILLW